MKRIIVGVSAADGVSLGRRLLERLRELPEVESYLVLSRSAEKNFLLETGESREEIACLADHDRAPEDMAADIASGSFQTDGMIVAPCSMKTLAAISCGYSDTLLTRAADVCLKERRPLVLITRETPLSLIHLRNMAAVTEAGAVVMPPVLTYYSGARTLTEQADCILGKALRQVGIELPGYRVWRGCEQAK